MDADAVNYGPDYDPENGSELLFDSAGNPIDRDYLESLADELESEGEIPAGTTVEFHVAGRPSLTAPGRRSPTVHFRVPEDLRDAVETRAKCEGKSVSALAREALKHYVG